MKVSEKKKGLFWSCDYVTKDTNQNIKYHKYNAYLFLFKSFLKPMGGHEITESKIFLAIIPYEMSNEGFFQCYKPFSRFAIPYILNHLIPFYLVSLKKRY